MPINIAQISTSRIASQDSLTTIRGLGEKPDIQNLITQIEEGAFTQFYSSAQALSESPLPQAEISIRQMIKSEVVWEKALGLILLGSRAAANQTMSIDAIKTINPFLSDQDPCLRQFAAIALQRTKTGSEGKADWPDPAAFQTAFFRHNFLLDALTNDLKAHTDTSTYLLWDAGCSSGFSTESIRIDLDQNKNPKTNIRIIGTDIDPFALLYAMRGKYLLESPSNLSRYAPTPYKNELEGFKLYSGRHGWNTDQAMKRFFKKEEGSLGPIYSIQRPGSEIDFRFDDITSSYSTIKDGSVQTIVYTNVHYLLNDEGKKNAIRKIYQKLAPGGKVFVIDKNIETFAEFEKVFGKPAKADDPRMKVYIKTGK
jgi:chemotaxis methyl-accepting protein methylase